MSFHYSDAQDGLHRSLLTTTVQTRQDNRRNKREFRSSVVLQPKRPLRQLIVTSRDFGAIVVLSVLDKRELLPEHAGMKLTSFRF